MSIHHLTNQLTKQSQHSINPSQNQQQITPFQILKVKVYPVINNVILKLIDHIVKSHQVQKHEERLKKKKLLDQLQRKYLQRQIEKQQLGSDYEQSDDEEYYKKLQMKKEDVVSLIQKRLEKTKIRSFKSMNKIQGLEKKEEELGGNVFNPVQFIIDELRSYQQLKKQGKLSQFQINDKVNEEPIKMKKQEFVGFD